VLITAVIAAITVFFLFQLPKARQDNNNIRFLPKDNHARVVSEYIDDTFGGSVMILVGLERPFGTVFDSEFLERVKDYVKAVEAVELVDDVNSIVSAPYISGSGDTITVGGLVPEGFSGRPEEIMELKRRILSWDLFRGSIVSADFSATQIIVTLDAATEESASPEVEASLTKIRTTAHEMFDGMAEVYVTGQPVINATINESVMKDSRLLTPLVILVVLLVLFFSFRRFTFVMLPLITVLVAVVWTIGAMALLGMKMSLLTTLLPVILVAVGSAYGIHLVTHYMEEIRRERGSQAVLSAEEHREIVFALFRKMLKPVFLAALTTFCGFVSFCFTPIVPMREFGYCASFGVLACFAVAVTLIPALLLIRGPKPSSMKERDTRRTGGIDNAIGAAFLAIARRRIPVLVVTVLVTALSLYGLSKIVVDNVLIEYFQNETDISRSDRFIREYFGGSKELTLVVVADTSEDLLDPAVLSAVDSLSSYLMERVPMTGKVAGFTDTIKRINQVFNVDESPLGLEPVAVISGEDFGFGFDDFNFSGEAEVLSELPLLDEKAVYNIDHYSVTDIFSMLDTASGEALSGDDMVRELKRLVNYDGFSYYEIPSIPERYGKTSPGELQRLISNYLVLLAGDIGAYLNDPLEPTAFKTTVQLRATGDKDVHEVIDTINAYVDANFPRQVRVLIGGGATIEGAVTELIVNAQIISIIIAVLMVFIIVSLSNRSGIAGIIAAVPLIIAILCNFAVMGFLEIKLNIGTALIASLAVGIGIDYTIHFIESFKREYKKEHAQGNDFLRRTFISCGKAILINAVSVGAGFGVLAFSQFKILAEFGALVAFSMVISALVSLTVIPALLVTIKPQFIYKATPQHE
jgi:predicted RND superfamily exporter protein